MTHHQSWLFLWIFHFFLVAYSNEIKWRHSSTTTWNWATVNVICCFVVVYRTIKNWIHKTIFLTCNVPFHNWNGLPGEALFFFRFLNSLELITCLCSLSLYSRICTKWLLNHSNLAMLFLVATQLNLKSI